MEPYDLRIVSITKVLFPRIKWSDRKLEEFERCSRFSILKKFIVIGQCRDLLKDLRTFTTEEDGFTSKRNSVGKKLTTKSFIMVYNLQT